MAAPGFNAAIKPKGKRSRTQGTGELPRLGLHPEIPGACTTPQCGAEADALDETGLQAGWVRVGVYGSTDPDRAWCSGLCATYGVALAELRVERPAVSADA
ncbi:hypothetical protein ACIRD8_35185 [Streptomyces sp. NPDC102451]|uniref:hypothetical protein n=1 Tax=Streptomyces sp. NPDC102451 TaxID=3366177 RepID=UPI003809D1C1